MAAMACHVAPKLSLHCENCQAAGHTEFCKVKVLAEDQDSKKFEVDFHVAANRPVQELRAQWARHYHIEVEAVALEDKEERVIELTRTPKDLGWMNLGTPMVLWAIPVDIKYTAEEDRGIFSAAGVPEKKMPERRQATVEEPEPEETPAAVPITHVSGTVSQTLGKSKRKYDEDYEAKPAKKQAIAAVDVEPVAPVASGSSPASAGPAAHAPATAENMVERSAAREPEAMDKSTSSPAKASAKPADKPAAKTSGKVAPKAVGKPKAKAATGKDSSRPEGDERILFVQENPKRPATSSHARYEKYKRAKTPKEALKLGAAPGDLVHDWSKGLFKRA